MEKNNLKNIVENYQNKFGDQRLNKIINEQKPLVKSKENKDNQMYKRPHEMSSSPQYIEF